MGEFIDELVQYNSDEKEYFKNKLRDEIEQCKIEDIGLVNRKFVDIISEYEVDKFTEQYSDKMKKDEELNLVNGPIDDCITKMGIKAVDESEEQRRKERIHTFGTRENQNYNLAINLLKGSKLYKPEQKEDLKSILKDYMSVFPLDDLKSTRNVFMAIICSYEIDRYQKSYKDFKQLSLRNDKIYKEKEEKRKDIGELPEDRVEIVPPMMDTNYPIGELGLDQLKYEDVVREKTKVNNEAKNNYNLLSR